MLSLGTAIRRLREEAGLPQRELADRAGISPSYLSRIEADHRDPTLDVLRRLTRELSVWPGLLLATVVRVEMPENVESIFEEFFDQISESVESTQLRLPLTPEES